MSVSFYFCLQAILFLSLLLSAPYRVHNVSFHDEILSGVVKEVLSEEYFVIYKF